MSYVVFLYCPFAEYVAGECKILLFDLYACYHPDYVFCLALTYPVISSVNSGHSCCYPDIALNLFCLSRRQLHRLGKFGPTLDGDSHTPNNFLVI